MILDEDSRTGFLSMKSEYIFHSLVRLPADPYQEYSINEIHRGCQLAPSQCMVCYILLMASKP